MSTVNTVDPILFPQSENYINMNYTGSAAYKAEPHYSNVPKLSEVGRPTVILRVMKLLKASEVGILLFLHCIL